MTDRPLFSRRQSLLGAAAVVSAPLFGPVVAGSTFSREPRGRPAADRSELATRGPKASPVHLVERGRDGVFDWVDEDLSARVAADPEQGLHVPPADEPDGRHGAWVRRVDGDLRPQWFGALAEIADNHRAITAADRMARTLGLSVSFSPGTYNLLADLLMTATWRLDEETILRFAGRGLTKGRRLIAMRSYGGREHRTTRLGHPPAFPRAALRDGAAGTKMVRTVSPSDAEAFAPGSIVRVSFGYDPYDADDPLYRYDRLNRVVRRDTVSGQIELETAIDAPIKAWGFEPGGPFYDPADWRAGERIAAGECRYHPHLAPGKLGGDPNIGGVFRARTTGTCRGADLLHDDGVAWDRVTNDYNGPGNVNQAQPFGRGTPYIDGRPVIELVDQPVNDIALIGGTILWAGTYPAIMGVEMRSVYRCRCEGTVIRSETQPVDIRWAVSEGSNGCLLADNVDATRPVAIKAPQDRTISIYSSDLFVRDHHYVQERVPSSLPLILVESFANLKISDNSRFESLSKGPSMTFCAATGGATFSIVDSTITGFAIVFIQRNPFTSAIGAEWFHAGQFKTVRGNAIEVSERQIRFAAQDFSSRDLYVGNRLTLTHPDTNHGNDRSFAPRAVRPVDIRFQPRAARKNTVVPLDEPLGSAIFLSAEARWDNPREGGEIVVYPRRAKGKELGRMLTSLVARNGGMLLSDKAPRGVVSGDGTAGRLIDRTAGEALHISYDSNQRAGSGTVSVRIWVMTE